jgi:tRNA/tmRNA/rRNA uracil-C5-methylase (TrmA/RlmC/RlmD family)
VRAPADPIRPDVDFGKRHGAGGIGVLRIGTHGKQRAHDLSRCPGDCCDGRDAESLVYLGAPGVIDARNHMLNAVCLPSYARGEDVRVVATADGGKCMGAFDTSILEGLAIKADSLHGETAELCTEFAEGFGVLIHHRHRMALRIEFIREHGTHAPAPKDHDVHAATLHAPGTYPDAVSTPDPLVLSTAGRTDTSTEGQAIAVGEEFEVTIGSVAHGGHCVARIGDVVAFVRHALPGERVRVRVTDVRRRFVRADAIDVLQPHSDRRPVMCAVAGVCGGCDFQHAAESLQRQLKFEVMHEALVRHGRLSTQRADELLADGVIDLAPYTGWRSRMSYRVGVDGSGGGVVGMSQHRSDEWVDASTCVLADPIGHQLAMATARDQSAGVNVLMATGIDGPVVAGNTPAGEVNVRQQVQVDGQSLEFDIPIDGFWQVHPLLAQALVDRLLEIATPQPGQTWWDLYAGAGPLAGALGVRVTAGGRVEAVEASKFAVERGKAALQDMPWVSWHRGDVQRWLHGKRRAAAHGVVLDPPRSGAGAQVVEAICGYRPRVVVVVACDPVALGRDTAIFAQHGYELVDLRVWDAFPQTHHMEAMACFRPTHQIS